MVLALWGCLSGPGAQQGFCSLLQGLTGWRLATICSRYILLRLPMPLGCTRHHLWCYSVCCGLGMGNCGTGVGEWTAMYHRGGGHAVDCDARVWEGTSLDCWGGGHTAVVLRLISWVGSAALAPWQGTGWGWGGGMWAQVCHSLLEQFHFP